NADRAFVGMASDSQLGFLGNTGANWGLVMDTTTGNVGIGIGATDPNAKLQVAGSIRSPMWNVTQVMNERNGPLTLTPVFGATFNTGGGTLLIFASGSGFSPSGGPIGMQILVDGKERGRALTFTNEIQSHKAFVANA